MTWKKHSGGAKLLLEQIQAVPGLGKITRNPILTSHGVNGYKSYVPQINRITILYDHPRLNGGGSSKGLVDFIKTRLPSIASAYPYVEFAVQNAPKRWPELRAVYANGHESSVYVRRFNVHEVEKSLLELVHRGGGVERKRYKPVVSDNPCVAGIWDPFTQTGFKP